jgi:autotransporter-associated beta strand protein
MLNRTRSICGAVVALALTATFEAHAANVYWTLAPSQSGDWSSTANWGGNLPTSNDTAYIVNGGTATVTTIDATCGTLSLGSAAGSGSVQMNSGELAARSNEYVGYSGTGTFSQSGGTNSLNGYDLYLGADTGSNGTYNLSGDGHLSAWVAYVGARGAGSFTQSGGYLNLGSALGLGWNPGSSGVCNLSGTGQLSARSESVAIGGPAIFTQSGGTNTISGGAGYGLSIGGNAAVSGVYSLSGGQLSAIGEAIGKAGPGTFNQSGGTNTASGSLTVGNSSSSSGMYGLSGGQLSAASEYVGAPGVAGSFQQTGGVNATPLLAISSSGSYLLAGGTLQVNSSFTNQGTFSGSGAKATLGVGGILDLTSGTWQNLGAISLSMSANSLLIVPPGFNAATSFANYGTLGLTHTAGITLAVPAGQSIVGTGAINDLVNCAGKIVAVSGGAVDLNTGFLLSSPGVVQLGNGALTVNDASSAISGGSLSAAKQYVGYRGTGVVSQTGGTSSVTTLNLGYKSGDSGTYNLSNGLLAPNLEWVGYSGTGTFTQTGGSNNLTGYQPSLFLGASGGNGTYNLSGSGQLSAWEVAVLNGTFSQSGAINSIGLGNLYIGSNASGSSGSYILSGGKVSTDTAYVGEGVLGTFTQSGGNAAIKNLYLGYYVGASGVYNLSGSGVLSTRYEYFGNSGAAGTFTQSGGTNTVSVNFNMPMTTGSASVYNLSGGLLAVSGNENVGLYGLGTFTQSGGTNIINGLFTLGYGSGSGTYNLNAGHLVLSSLTQGPGVAVFNFSGGTLQASGSFSSSLPMTLGNSGGGATFDTAGYAVTLSGSLSGPGSLSKVDSGTLILAATNTYSGNTLVSAGTLALGSSLALQQSILDTSGGGTLSFGSLSAATLGGLTGPGTLNLTTALSVGNNSSSTTFSGSLTGPGSVTKIGSGALAVTGSSTYSGPTTINQGELVVNGSLISPATVNNGGILGGMGSLSSVTVNSGGTLAPGDAFGTLSVTGSLILSSGAAMDYGLDTPTTSDMASCGNLTLSDQQFSDFHFTWTPNFGPGTYNLIAFGSLGGTGLGNKRSGTINGYPAYIAIQSNDLVLNVVPEPSTLALLATGALGLLAWEWRRRKPLA